MLSSGIARKPDWAWIPIFMGMTVEMGVGEYCSFRERELFSVAEIVVFGGMV